MAETNNFENRVLVLMPTGRDAALVCATLEKAGINAESCADAEDLTAKMTEGAGTIILAEEALSKETLKKLAEKFEEQPVWSDLQVVLFAGNAQNAEMLSATVGAHFNATIVERPIRIPILISAVRGALRARERQYQSRNLLNQLAESDHQKDLFLATLSHELRTPLNSILGWIQLIKNNSQTIDVNHGLEIIERNAKAQAEIVSDILVVSRIITGKLTINVQPIDLIPVLQSAIETIIPFAREKEIGLKTNFDSDIRIINGSYDRLKQVFWNILSNAVKFTPNYGQIDIQTSVVGENIQVEIKDSGQGIDAEFVPFVFERFRQADSTYTRKAGGLGLGLAIVRHLVELHGGEVSVASRGINQGSTFTVSLPVTDVGDSPSSNGESLSGKNDSIESGNFPAELRILLVEDNEDSREMLEVLLAQYNIKVTAVDSVAKALVAFEDAKPDILISDIGMPDEDGYDLIRKIRRLSPEKGGQIPAIALTGYAGSKDRDLAIKAGYQEHFSKPIDADNLINLLKNLLDYR